MSGLKAFESIHKLLTDNIVVAKVPYFETSNDSNGNTAYIGKEV